MTENTSYPAGLDVGSERTRCAICLLENQRVRFLGAGEFPSHGWVKGRITDQRAVAETVLAALREAERQAQVSIESAVVGIGGTPVRGANARGVVELGRPREAHQRDVNRAIHVASLVQLMEDRMILQIFPQDFVVDEQPGHRDPRGMVASRLEANVHLITASRQEHETLVGAVNLAHLSVDETVFEPLAACYAAVLPEERREGIALVDIGAHSTGVVVYYGDSLQLASSLAICGDHFTRDLARRLMVSFEDAEAIKRQFGSAVASATSANSFVELPPAEGGDPREAPRRLVSEVLEARAQELFQYVQRELARVGMERSLMGGLVLTGGGAALSGICDVAERALFCQSRKGLAVGVADWPDELDNAAWTVAAGLALYSAKLRKYTEEERRAGGLLGRILSH